MTRASSNRVCDFIASFLSLGSKTQNSVPKKGAGYAPFGTEFAVPEAIY